MGGQATTFSANLRVLDMLGKYVSVSLLPTERPLGGSPRWMEVRCSGKLSENRIPSLPSTKPASDEQNRW